MTPEEIKKIAEEFASLKNPNSGYHGENSAEYKMARLFEQFVNFIQMRYYIVDKGKAKDEYEWYAGNLNWSECTANDDVAESFRNLFGSEIGKEEEE